LSSPPPPSSFSSSRHLGDFSLSIGYGTFVPSTTLGKAVTLPYALFGFCLFGYSLSLLTEAAEACITPAVRGALRRATSALGGGNNGDDAGDGAIGNRSTEARKMQWWQDHLLLAVYVLLLLAWLVLMSVFAKENEFFSFLDAFYFAFVTVSDTSCLHGNAAWYGMAVGG
jgi:hypothetical protein